MTKLANRFKISDTRVPESPTEASHIVSAITENQQTVEAKTAEMQSRIAAIKELYEPQIAESSHEIETLIHKLHCYADPRKAELTKETRTTTCANGEFGWRWTTPFVDIGELSEEDAIALLKSNGLGDYFRTKETLNREQLLEDRPVIPGVTYDRRDEFFVKPLIKGSKKVFTYAIDLLKGKK